MKKKHSLKECWIDMEMLKQHCYLYIICIRDIVDPCQLCNAKLVEMGTIYVSRKLVERPSQVSRARLTNVQASQAG